MKEKRLTRCLAFILVFALIASIGIFGNTVIGLTPPLTVEEAIENQDSNNRTVRGYIIGTVKRGPELVRSDFTVDTNLMLASDKNETKIDQMLPVQLPKGNVRDAWNLVDHPDRLGTFVDVTGDLTTYFGVPGLKNASDITEVTGGESSLLTIAEARLVTGSTVFETSGIVTMVDGKSITTQDETAGIVARISAVNPKSSRVTGSWLKGHRLHIKIATNCGF